MIVFECGFVFLCVCVCLSLSFSLFSANASIAQNGKFQKDIDIQSKEIKDLYVANGGKDADIAALREKLSSLLHDTNLQIKTVRKLLRDYNLDRDILLPSI